MDAFEKGAVLLLINDECAGRVVHNHGYLFSNAYFWEQIKEQY
jgi:hypothetical protein